MKETNGLAVAGEVLQATQVEVNEIMRGLGRHEALQFIRNGASAAAARQYATLKANNAHLLVGRKTWDEFCRLELGMDRKTVDGYINALAELGEKYFATAKLIRVPVNSYKLIEGHIDDTTGEIEIDGERLAFTKQNAPRIKAFIESQKRDLGDTKEEVARSKRAASEAKKALSTLKARDSKLFGDATPAQMLIYKAESNFLKAMAELSAAQAHETFDHAGDVDLLHMMCQFMWSMVDITGTYKVPNTSPVEVIHFDRQCHAVGEALAERFVGDGEGLSLPSQLVRTGKVKEFRKPQ